MVYTKETYNGFICCVPSISGDGRVSNWIIVKTALWWEDKMTVMFKKVRTTGTSGASFKTVPVVTNVKTFTRRDYLHFKSRPISSLSQKEKLFRF